MTDRSPAATEQHPLAELLGETSEIPGRNMILDGKTWLVTTEADIRQWIAQYIHVEVDQVDQADVDARVCRCRCGWSTGPSETWGAATRAVRDHITQAVEALLARYAPTGTTLGETP